ncbi:RHS repeat domain-containing protein [Aquitalea denitrificans]|uniref:RHS repeat domain-containing protein n=1 Tax=Aquitalea denitrificans TaxID=519081 RepID=UPI00135B7C3C|nr:RHS repeat domain-containing protein [Aquitalea denitrificans]
MLRPSLLLGCLSLTLLGTALAEAPNVIDVPEGSFYVVNGVNVRNGNYSTTFSTLRDADDPAGEPFKRVYNSFSTYQSVYGLGWATAMDSRITLTGNGDLALSLREKGVGATTKYVVQPGAPGSKSSMEMKKRLIDFESEYAYRFDQVAKRREIIKTDAYKEMVKRGELKPFSESSLRDPAYPSMESVIPDGAVFVATNAFQGDTCHEQGRIIRQGDHLVRSYPDGCAIAREIYTLDGVCTRVDSQAGGTLAITKDPATGWVTSVEDKEKGGITQFQYDAKGRLVHEANPNGNAFGFEYDGHDNMTAIIYIDNTRSRMTYDDKNRVTLSAPRNRPVATFEYRTDPANSSIAVTHVKLTDGDQTQETDYRLH